MKVNVYDFEQVLSELDGKKNYPGFSDEIALIVGKDRVILVDKDGDYDVIDLDISIKYLINNAAPVDNVELSIFLSKCNEAAYLLLLMDIQAIGLDIKDYDFINN